MSTRSIAHSEIKRKFVQSLTGTAINLSNDDFLRPTITAHPDKPHQTNTSLSNKPLRVRKEKIKHRQKSRIKTQPEQVEPTPHETPVPMDNEHDASPTKCEVSPIEYDKIISLLNAKSKYSSSGPSPYQHDTIYRPQYTPSNTPTWAKLALASTLPNR